MTTKPASSIPFAVTDLVFAFLGGGRGKSLTTQRCVFIFKRIADNYKMIGNAVPFDFARSLADQINEHLKDLDNKRCSRKTGKFKSFDEILNSKKETKKI